MGRGWLWTLDKRGVAYRLSASDPMIDLQQQQSKANNGAFDESLNCSSWRATKSEIALRKLTTSSTCAWAIGSNSKPYLFVYSSEFLCRITEEVYENQRWFPVTGFTSRLLPTDRDPWSNLVGEPIAAPERQKLPSRGWEWEDPWTPECNPRLADKEGWMYARDFPQPYFNARFTTAFVRRRRWTRTRRYTAVDRWIKIDLPSKYLLVDIAAGGTDIPGQEPGFLCVWALAANGKVLFRSGISRLKPEGSFWYEIDPPTDVEFIHLACSPSNGRLFAITWEGRLFRRTGQLNACYVGIDWEELPAPVDLRFLHVALGDNAIWAITMDGRVWFARLYPNGDDEPLLTENAWLDMDCAMSDLSIGPADQVFAVGLLDDSIYWRTDVSERELSGRGWQGIVVPEEKPIIDESLVTPIDDNRGEPIMVYAGQTLARNIPKAKLRITSASDTTSMVVAYRHSLTNEGGSVRLGDGKDTGDVQNRDSTDSVASSNEETGDGIINDEETKSIITADEEGQECSSEDEESTTVRNTSSDSEREVFEPTNPFWNSDQEETESLSSSTFTSVVRATHRWSAILAGGCFISPSSTTYDSGPPAFWFSTASSSSTPRSSIHRRPKCIDHKTQWRKTILRTLKQRNATIWAAFSDYPFAFERDTWTRTLATHLWSVHCRKWMQVVIFLTQSWKYEERRRGDGSTDEEDPIGLTIKFTEKKNGYEGKCAIVSPDDLDCVRREFDGKLNKFVLVLYVQKVRGDPGVRWDFPLRLGCQSEEEQRTWAKALDEMIGKHHMAVLLRTLSLTMNDPIGPDAVWAVAGNGAVYVGQPGAKCLIQGTRWRHLGGHFKLVEAGFNGVVWALGYDGRAWVYSPSTTDQTQDDTRTDIVYENQRWSRLMMKYIPLPRLMSGNHYAWSDESGRRNTPKESFKLPGSEWQWLNEWRLDFGDECDPEGWQYSKGFDHAFMGQKKYNYSTVRRRKWMRRRRIVTHIPIGAWSLIPPSQNTVGRDAKWTKIVVESHDSRAPDASILVLAITEEGDLFCRLGVTQESPEGLHWQHVLTEAKVQDVALGSDRKLWIIGRNGFAYCCYAANHEDLLSSGWHEISPPNKSKSRLKKIAAGDYAVYALDWDGRVYCRLDTTPWCPEGVAWVSLVNTTAIVEHIALSRDNQLWALLKSSDSQYGSAIGRRYDIRGYDALYDIDWWDVCNVDGWAHVSPGGYGVGVGKTKLESRQTIVMMRLLSRNQSTGY